MGAPTKDADRRPGTDFAGEGATLIPETLTLTTLLSGERDIAEVRRVGSQIIKIEDGKLMEDPILDVYLGPSISQAKSGQRPEYPHHTVYGSNVKAEEARYQALCEAVKDGYIHWPYQTDQATVDARWAQVLKALPTEISTYTLTPEPAAQNTNANPEKPGGGYIGPAELQLLEDKGLIAFEPDGGYYFIDPSDTE